MKRRRNSRRLSQAAILQLRRIRLQHRLSFVELAEYMAAPFSHVTLQHAMEGHALWDLNWIFLMDWLQSEKARKKRTDENRHS